MQLVKMFVIVLAAVVVGSFITDAVKKNKFIG